MTCPFRVNNNNNNNNTITKLLYGEDRELGKAMKKMMDQDITYVLSLDRETFDSSFFDLFREIKQISWSRKPYNIRRKKALVCQIEDVMRRLYYDQTYHDQKLNRPIHPKQIVRKIDRITTQGMARLSEIFAGESSAYYNFMNYGGSQIEPELGDWRLYEEFSRASILEAGFSSGSGTIVKHGASFSINDETKDIYEFGATDFPTFNEYQTLWFRSVVDEPVLHEQGKDVLTVSHAAYFVSVSDFEEQLAEGTI